MRLFFKGFNLYGQIPLADPLVKDFTTCSFEDDLKNILITHSFSIFHFENTVVYNGPNPNSQIYKLIQEKYGKIVEVTASNDRILVLSEKGHIIKLNIDSFQNPVEIPNFCSSDDNIIKIQSGLRINVGYSANGFVFNIPNQLHFQKSKIIDFKCGREHCLLLDELGNVYSFGRGSRGQLGHGCLDDETDPVQINALAGLKIIKISTGDWHSCAVSLDGDLYTWGWNGNGQLGLKSRNGKTNETEENSVAVMATPTLVDIDLDVNVNRVACGSKHTVVLLDNSKLYGSGWNKYKQLINEDEENYYEFTYMHDFSNEEVFDLKCGSWSTAVLCK